MLTNNLLLTFCVNEPEPRLSLSLSDRNGILGNDLTFTDRLENTVSFDIVFPNTLYIEIKDINHIVYLKNIVLSGLTLPDLILDQICQYRLLGSDSEITTRHWHQSGTVKIDFFASDWIQYHLLYGNKIIKQ